MKLTPLASGLAALLLASSAAAQTTHVVSVSGLDFSPANLTITVGDTIDWVWGVGIHTVTSGSGGVPDGIFTNGGPVGGPLTYSLTFDQAFLDANPVAGNLYRYFCEVHDFFGMRGTVTVATAAACTVRNGGGNPAGFACVTTPVLGASWMSTVDIATPGHLASIVAVSTTGPISFPLSPPFQGNLLVLPPIVAIDVAVGAHSIPIPNDLGLLGLTVYTQGASFNPGVIALNNAIDLEPGV